MEAVMGHKRRAPKSKLTEPFGTIVEQQIQTCVETVATYVETVENLCVRGT